MTATTSSAHVGRGERPIAASPDGSKLVAACTDGKARIWDLAGKPIAELVGHAGPVSAVEWSADAAHIATASEDGTARLWSSSGEPIAVLGGHAGKVNNVALAPDGSRVVTVSGSQVWLWDAAGQQLATLDGQLGAKPATDVEFSPDGSRIAVSNNGMHTWIWDIGGNVTAMLESGRNTRLIEFFPDGSGLATAGFDPTPRLWQLSGRLMSILRSPSSLGIEFSANSARILLPGRGGEASLLWNAHGKLLATFPEAEPAQIGLSPDGTKVVTAVGGVVRLWDAHGRELELPSHEQATAIAFSPDGSQVAIASERGVRIWHLANRTMQELGERPLSVSSLRFAPGGEHLIAVERGTLHIWRRDGTFINTIHSPNSGKFHAYAFSPNGTIIAAESDGELRFWLTATGELANQTIVHDVKAVAFAPDGTRIVSGHTDSAARIWQLDGRELIALAGHGDAVLAVAWSPDGEHIATGGNETVVRIWRANSGELVAILEGHTERVLDVVIAPDGSRIATSSRDRTTRVWHMPRAMLQVACERLATRGVIRHAASLGLFAEGGVAESSQYPDTTSFRLLALDENPGATRRAGLHHGLLATIPERQRVADICEKLD